MSRRVAAESLELIMSLERRPSTINDKYYEYLVHKYEAQYKVRAGVGSQLCGALRRELTSIFRRLCTRHIVGK